MAKAVILDTPTKTPAINSLARLAKLMDAQFSIPGTGLRFGLDGILGLIPGVGDLSTMAVSGYMISIMAKNGASGALVARMVINVIIDAIIGAIPFVGDIFDFGWKANTKNVRLMQEHYVEGRHRGGAWRVLLPALLIMILIVAGIIWVAVQLWQWVTAQF